MVAPEIEKVATQEAGRLLVGKVDTEALPGLGHRMAVRGIPLMAVFVRGSEADRSAGARAAAGIVEFVSNALSRAK